MKFNNAGPDGLIDRKPPGQPALLNDNHRAALAAMIESGPIPAVHGVVRWRIVDLCQWVWDEFRISIARQSLSRELRKLAYRKLSARPRHHAQAVGAIEDFEKVSPPVWTRSRRTKASYAATQRSGWATKPGSGRRTRAPAAGRGAAPGRPLRATSARPRPRSSARSAPGRARRSG